MLLHFLRKIIQMTNFNVTFLTINKKIVQLKLFQTVIKIAAD